MEKAEACLTFSPKGHIQKPVKCLIIRNQQFGKRCYDSHYQCTYYVTAKFYIKFPVQSKYKVAHTGYEKDIHKCKHGIPTCFKYFPAACHFPCNGISYGVADRHDCRIAQIAYALVNQQFLYRFLTMSFGWE